MKFLLHSSEATYESATKKFLYNLDERITNPTVIQISKACFTCTTDTSPYPDVVYMRSRAIHNMITTKHTVELKDDNHEGASDVLAVLTETHTRGRYRFIGSRTFFVNPNMSVKKIDLYFTNGATVLDGMVTNGNNNAGNGGSAVTDATIEAFTDPTVWIDLAPARTLTAGFATCTTLGDLPRYLYSRSPTPAGLIMYGNWDFELVNFKTGLLGISRDTNPSHGHGQALNDSSYPTSSWDQEFQVHHIFKTHADYTQTAGLFKLNNNQCRVWITGNGGINFRNSASQNVTLTNLHWVPDTVYILSIKREYNSTTSAYEFKWRLENVEGGTNVTETSDAGDAVPSGGNQSGWSLGISGMYFRHTAGPLLGCNGLDQTEYDDSISWLKNWYGADEEEGEEESGGGASENASFFAELDIKRQN